MQVVSPSSTANSEPQPQPQQQRRPSLWGHHDFLKLWFGQTVSVFGSSISDVAIPLIAVVLLQARPSQMGLLSLAQYLPFALVGLFAGALVDRLPRRLVLIVSDAGRALFLSLIPLLALFGLLHIELLYAVTFGVGILTVFFEVAYTSYLPTLIGRDDLVEGNSKLQTTLSAAQVVGPGLAGGLVQIIAAPLAILLDAASFLVSVLSLRWIRLKEPRPAQQTDRHLLREIGEGLRYLWKNPIVRALVGCSATANIFVNMYIALYAVYALRDLRFSPALFGALATASGIGGVLGAMVAPRLARRFSIGQMLIGCQLAAAISPLLLSFLRGPLALLALEYGVVLLLWDMGVMVYGITGGSLRQAIIPNALQGRVAASSRMISWGIPSLGFVLGGWLGEWLDIHLILALVSAGLLLSIIWLIPLRAIRQPSSE